MGLMYLKKKWICKQFENKSMNLILNLSFYQKSGIPEKEGKMASLLMKKLFSVDYDIPLSDLKPFS